MNRTHRIAAQLTGLLAIAASVCAVAQTQSADAGHWLNCDVDWIVTDSYREGPDFTVRVSFREQPISGVKVVLMGEEADPSQRGNWVVATGDTDANGFAHFFAIPPGSYQAHIDQALEAPSQAIQVEANNPEPEQVAIEWPSAPLKVQSLAGEIFSWQKSSPQNRAELRPHRNALVQLLDLRSGKSLASTHTDSDGYYDFLAHHEGLFVIRIAEHEDPSINSYDLAVEVARDSLYPMPKLAVDRVCGRGLVAFLDAEEGGMTEDEGLTVLNEPK